MKQLISLLLVVFLVTACFGETEENDVSEENGATNGEAKEENGQVEEGVTEYLDCELLDTDIEGEFSIKFVDQKIKNLEGRFYAEAAEDIPSPEQAYALFEQELERHFDGVEALDEYTLERDDNVFIVDLVFDFGLTDFGAEGYYVHLIEEELYLPENMPIDEASQEIVSEQITCEER